MIDNDSERTDCQEQSTPPQAEEQAPATQKSEESAPGTRLPEWVQDLTAESEGLAFTIGGAMIPKSRKKES
jgi:hypothetical protein